MRNLQANELCQAVGNVLRWVRERERQREGAIDFSLWQLHSSFKALRTHWVTWRVIDQQGS